jgi:hypothetical protein
MGGTPTPVETTSALQDAIADLKNTAREQLSAAWQIHVERVQERLLEGWAQQIERVFDERFEDLAVRVEEQFQRKLANELASAQSRSRRELTERINQSFRRIAAAETAASWSAALLDATRDFAAISALFFVSPEVLRCEAVRAAADHPAQSLIGREIPLASAPAFASAVDSKDPVVAFRSPGELSEPVAQAFGAKNEGRAYLFPLLSRQRVVAVLYCEPGEQPVDSNGLELLCALAANALEERIRSKGASGLIGISAIQSAVARETPWASLSREEQDLHLRAQRFARVQVAEMRLYKAGAVKAGRAEGRLYESLREDIEAGREEFYRQFIATCPSMVDYFHLELVRTLANDDASLLGPDYPGPLV